MRFVRIFAAVYCIGGDEPELSRSTWLLFTLCSIISQNEHDL